MFPRRALSIAALFLAAGCTGGRDATRDARQAETGGTLVVASPGDADVLLPPVTGVQLGAHVTSQIFSRLADPPLSMNTIGDSGFVPVLAERWERRDSLTIVFHLDSRARWQDGQPITAADVAFTFDLYRDTLTGSNFTVNLEPIASVTAEGERAVAYRFHRSYPEQFYDATYHLMILPKHLLERIPRDSLASSLFGRDPVGAGPFRFHRWDAGSEIEVVADTTWFRGRPRLNRILWRVLPDVSSAVSALLAGEADAMETILQPDEIERAKRSPDLRLEPYPSPFIGGLLFNLQRPPFADRDLRRALSMALDRATIVRAVFGEYADVPPGALSRMVWAAGGDRIGQLPFDTIAAMRTLDSAGWRQNAGARVRTKNGQPLRFTLLVPSTSRVRQQAATLVQDQWRKVGVDVTISVLEFAVFDQRLRTGNYEAAVFSRTLDPSPANLAQFWSSRGIGQDNQSHYASAGFDSLLTAATRAPTRDAALPLYHAALEQLNQDVPAVFLYAPRNHAVIHRRFENVTIRPDSWLATVASWSVPPSQRLPRDQ